jgi:hypothetical protein
VSSDQYRQIYDYVKGGVSSEALAGKLSELGIRDPNIIKAVQDATANGKTKGRAGWSTALRDALGLKDAAVLLD